MEGLLVVDDLAAGYLGVAISGHVVYFPSNLRLNCNDCMLCKSKNMVIDGVVEGPS
jgi:hypothetical protein